MPTPAKKRRKLSSTKKPERGTLLKAAAEPTNGDHNAELPETALADMAALDVSDCGKTEAALLEARKDLQIAENKLGTLTTDLIGAEEIRRRLARELHDVYAQRLASLGMQFSVIEKKIPGSAREARCGAHAAVKEMRALTDELREFARGLHPAVLEQLGLLKALQSEIEAFFERNHIRVRLSHDKVPKDLSHDISTALYRIAQQALQNISEHANAGNVWLRVVGGKTRIGLEIRDDGQGMPTNGPKPKGLGLISMEERARSLGGNFTVEPRNKKGTTIKVQLPLRRTNATLANPAR